MKIEMIKWIETVYHEKFSFPTNCKKEKKEKSWNVSKISFHLHNIKITENIRLGCVSSKKTNRSKTRNLGWYVQRKTMLLYVTTSREYRVRMLLTTFYYDSSLHARNIHSIRDDMQILYSLKHSQLFVNRLLHIMKKIF